MFSLTLLTQRSIFIHLRVKSLYFQFPEKWKAPKYKIAADQMSNNNDTMVIMDKRCTAKKADFFEGRISLS